MLTLLLLISLIIITSLALLLIILGSWMMTLMDDLVQRLFRIMAGL